MRNTRPRLFDYDQLDPRLAQEMRDAAGRVRKLIPGSAVEVGCELLAVKERLDHGHFLSWLKLECQLHVRTAQRLILVADTIAKNDNLSYLPPDGLLALASRAAPEPVVNAIVNRINSGDTPTAVEIKREIAAAKRQARAEASHPGETSGGQQATSGERVQQAVISVVTDGVFQKTTAGPEQQFAELMQAWEQAGVDVRDRFLARIGALGPSTPVAVPTPGSGSSLKRAETAGDIGVLSPKPVADVGAADQRAGSQCVDLQDHLLPAAALQDAPADPAPSTIEDDEGEALLVSDSPCAFEDIVAKSVDATEPPRMRLPVARNVTVLSTNKSASLCESWAGSRPPGEVPCNAPSGVCRYTGCSRHRSCQAPILVAA